MNESDDQLISAYLDGELNETERKTVEDRLIQDDEFASRFAQFSDNDEAIAKHYAEIDNTPVPELIMSMLEPAEKTVQEAPENVVSMASWRKASWLPLAASFVLVALVVPVYFSLTQDASLSLVSALENELSGQKLMLDSGQEMQLSMSFNDNQGNLCREYFVSEESSAQHVVSCKIDGQWEAQVADSMALNPGQVFQPASGELSEEVENWLDANMGSDPLTPQQEQQRLVSDK